MVHGQFTSAFESTWRGIDYESGQLTNAGMDAEDLNDHLDAHLDRVTSSDGEPDYYMILKVNRNAGIDDIKYSYRQLCLALHPDKHPEPGEKEIANSQYSRIKKAYDVLSNPSRRRIYDLYGSKAADASITSFHNRMGPNMDTGIDESEIYEDPGAGIEEHDTKGNITLKIDARKLLSSDPRIAKRRIKPAHLDLLSKQNDKKSLFDISLPAISEMSINYTTNIISTPYTTLALAGYSSNSTNSAFKGLSLNASHLLNQDTVISLSSTLGSSPGLEARIVRNLSKLNFVAASLGLADFSSSPTADLTIGRRLTNSTVGTLRLITDFDSDSTFGGFRSLSPLSCIIGTTTCSRKTRLSFEAKSSYTDSSLGMSYIYPIINGVRAKVHASVSVLFGLTGEIYCVKKFSEDFYAGLGISCSRITGTYMNTRFAIGRQSLNIPVTLYSRINLKFMTAAVSMYLLSIMGVERFIAKPKRIEGFKKKLSLIRQANSESLKRRLQECCNEQLLLRNSHSRSLESESACNGLIILEALYGKVTEHDIDIWKLGKIEALCDVVLDVKGAEQKVIKTYIIKLDNGQQSKAKRITNLYNDGIIDITIPIQSMVKCSSLIINKGISKSCILGSMNPCVGERKKLSIAYMYLSKLHFVTLRYDDLVAIPIKAHLLTESVEA